MSHKKQLKTITTKVDALKSRNWALFGFLVIFAVIFYGLGLLRIKTG